MGLNLAALRISPEHSILQAMASIDRNGEGITMVVDSENRLIGTVTDGDIRRAILSGMNLELPIKSLLKQRPRTSNANPLTAPVGTSDADLLHMMNQSTLRQIPIVDEEGRLVDVALLKDLVKDYELPLAAVVMAGGYGARLRPLTEGLPKPMLPVGDRPLLEWTIKQLQRAGIRRVNLATHYKGDMIAQHFGDGRGFGLEIKYVHEDQPLGTAGALGLFQNSDEPLLVVNGDILTGIDFRAMLDFHREQQADMSVAVKRHEIHVPYGVIDTNGPEITAISEKPAVRVYINAGIYLLNPVVCRLIPSDRPYDMPDLIRQLVREGRRVVSFPVREYWLDIGKVEDYQKAQADAKKGKV